MTDHSFQLSREEQAIGDIGRTDVRPGVAAFLTVVFIAAISIAPAIQNIVEFRQYQRGERTTRLPPCDEIVLRVPEAVAVYRESSGNVFARVLKANRFLLKEMNTYERTLEDSSWLTAAVLPRSQQVLSGRLGVGNEKAYVGREGWLFYRPDVDYATGRGFLEPRQMRKRAASRGEWANPLQPDPVQAIVTFHQQLEKRGIRLVLLPTPLKPSVHPDKLSAAYPDRLRPVQNISYGEFLRQMRRNGVLVFDPSGWLAGSGNPASPARYLATDTHWRPETVDEVAAALADRIAGAGVLPLKESANYARKKTEVESLGDIATMLRLPDDQRLFPAETVEILQVLNPDLTPWEPDPSSDVLVLGDSFSNIYSLESLGWGRGAGLAEQLSFHLQRPVDRIVRNDEGAFATRETLARDLAEGRDRLAGKKVVIWQFAMRELSQGDWKLIPMAQPK